MLEVTDSFFDHFNDLDEPRADNARHGMSEILFVRLCGVICGCAGWKAIEDYGKTYVEFLRNYLALKKGIPRTYA